VQFLVSPTVFEELAHKAGTEADMAMRVLARTALSEMRTQWQFQPAFLNAVQEALVSQSADRLRRSGLMPYEERNDGFVLAEAAVLNCTLLVTEDSHLRSIDFERLLELFREMDLIAPVIATPREIVRRFRR
jgi:predicted nucleic acid-binding protein